MIQQHSLLLIPRWRALFSLPWRPARSAARDVFENAPEASGVAPPLSSFPSCFQSFVVAEQPGASLISIHQSGISISRCPYLLTADVSTLPLSTSGPYHPFHRRAGISHRLAIFQLLVVFSTLATSCHSFRLLQILIS